MIRSSKPISFACLLAALPLLAFCSTALGANEKGLSSASPRVLNLSKLLTVPPHPKAKNIVLEALDNSTGKIPLILKHSRAPQDDQTVLSVRMADEKSLILMHRDTVNRMNKVLSIKGQNNDALKFIDWSRAETNHQDGDGETFRYAGMLANIGYHKIDVSYLHDSPGSFLVSPKTNSILYVHSDDLASIPTNSPLLMIMNNGLNPPFGIGIINLQKAEEHMKLHCQGRGDRKPEIIPFFKGWHVAPSIGFDVVLLVEMTDAGSGRYEAIPIQFTQDNRQWHVFVPEPQRFTKITGISCWQQ